MINQNALENEGKNNCVTNDLETKSFKTVRVVQLQQPSAEKPNLSMDTNFELQEL